VREQPTCLQEEEKEEEEKVCDWSTNGTGGDRDETTGT
jgi:hypothetical protein